MNAFTFAFDFSTIAAAAQDALGQDVLIAKADAEVLRNSAMENRKLAIHAEGRAEALYEEVDMYTSLAKATFKAFNKAMDEAKNNPEIKMALTLAYDHEDTGRKEAIFSAIREGIWSQLVAQNSHYAADLNDLRDVKCNPVLTLVDLFNEYATNSKFEADLLMEKARSYREESTRLFAKADQTLIDAGLGAIVEHAREQAKARKTLEKSVKNYKK